MLAHLRSWQDPFNPEVESLINIASNVEVSKEVQKDILSAFEAGKQSLQQFLKDRLGKGKVGFYEPLNKLKLHSFSTMLKKKSVKVDKSKVVLKADRGIFTWIIVMAQTRLLQLQQVLQYELGPLPWSLYTGDDSLAKTQKSALLNLARYAEPVEDVPPNAAIIVDVMALLQSLVSPATTFGELARHVFEVLTNSLGTARSRVDFVINRYLALSIP